MVDFRRNLVRKKMDETRVHTDLQFRTVLRALWDKKLQEHAAATPGGSALPHCHARATA